MSVKLTISVPDIDSVIASFNTIRVKRSTTLEAGPYSIITDDTPVKATLPATGVGPYNVQGKTLDLAIDNQLPFTTNFVGTAPLTTTNVAGQINTAAGATIAFDDANTLKLESTVTGTGSAVDIVGGTSIADFGWTVGQRDIGEEAHITLVPAQNLYDFTDKNGDADFFYVAQFFNTTTQLASVDSEPFKGDPGTVVGVENLSLATVDLADGSGIAVVGQEISFYSLQDPLAVDGFQIALVRQPIVLVTDNSGHAEKKFVRGLKMRVVFEGTSLIRDIVIPDADNFDLLALMSSAPDPYSVVDPPFPFAIRRSV